MNKRIIYIAFPGSGKTTLVKQLNKGRCCEHKVAVDLDLPKVNSNMFNTLMDLWCLEYLAHGFTVFTHNYNMNYAAMGDDIILVFAYPFRHYKEEWLLRLKNRGDSDAFISKVDENWDQWISDYERNIFRAAGCGCDVRFQVLGKDDFLKLLD